MALHDQPSEPEVRAGDVVFAGHVWDVRSDTFVHGEDELTRHYVDHPGAAAVVAVDDRERVLLIQQYRHPIRSRDWEIPAGLLDVVGEEPLATAQRELAEEADLQAAHWESLGGFWPTPGGSSEIIHLFLARDVSATATSFAREAEEAQLRVEWLPLDEVIEAIQAGRMRNGTLALAVLLAGERLRTRRG